MNHGQHPDELISASLSGELGFEERGMLEAHLAMCDRCRTLRSEFIEQRRLLGGMRREQAPASLAPRLRQAVESGATGSPPWWRRRSLLPIGAAAVAVLVLGVTAGLAIQGGRFDGGLVGGPATASPAVASASPTLQASPRFTTVPTATLASSPVATATPSAAPPATPSPAPPATEPPPPASPLDPGSVAFLELSGETDTQVLTVREPTLDENGYPTDFESAEPPVSHPSEWSGQPMYAELSPDGEWLAYQTERGQSGITDLWVVRLADDTVISLGETIADTPFMRRMTWSHDSHQLAYTLAAPANPGAQDVWMFDTLTLEVFQLVATGDSYAASWQDADRLWISRAGERPASYRLTLAGAGAPTGPNADPAANASQTVDGAFQPLFSPDGRHAIFWRGAMDLPEADTWRFEEGGMPYLVAVDPEAQVASWDDAQKLFPDLQADRDAFSFASITWSYNSDDYAVWNTVWTGTPRRTNQTDRGDFPDSTLIYFGEVSTGQLITEYPYVDLVNQREDRAVVRDVEFTPGPPDSIGAIWSTVQLLIGGDMQTAVAVLEVTPAGPSGYEPAEARQGVWRGPAFYLAQPQE